MKNFILSTIGSVFFKPKFHVGRCTEGSGERFEKFLDSSYEWICIIGVPLALVFCAIYFS